MEKSIKLPTRELSRTPEEALGKFLDTHSPNARSKKGPEGADQPGKIRVNSENWKKAKQVVTKDKITWAVKTFIPYRAPSPDGIHPICMQIGLGITIKHLTGI